MLAQHEESKRDFQHDQGDYGQILGVEVLVHPSCKQSHDRDANVYNASEQSKFEFVHSKLLLDLYGACRQYAVIEIDKNICYNHDCEDEGWRAIFLFVGFFLLIHKILAFCLG